MQNKQTTRAQDKKYLLMTSPEPLIKFKNNFTEMFLIMNKMTIRAKKAISLNNISLATCQNNISNICQDSVVRSRALLFVLFCFFWMGFFFYLSPTIIVPERLVKLKKNRFSYFQTHKRNATKTCECNILLKMVKNIMDINIMCQYRFIVPNFYAVTQYQNCRFFFQNKTFINSCIPFFLQNKTINWSRIHLHVTINA